MRKEWLLLIVLMYSGRSNAQLCFSGEMTFLAFLGESKAILVGPEVKGIYFMNDWTGVYGGVGVSRSGQFDGTVEVVATNAVITPSSLIKKTAVTATVFSAQFGLRRYLIGDHYVEKKRGYGVYVDGKFSLLLAKVKSGVPEYDQLNYESPIVQETRGDFVNYTGGVVIGADKVIGYKYLYSEVGVGATIDQANRFVVDVTWPFYLSLNVGIRFYLSGY